MTEKTTHTDGRRDIDTHRTQWHMAFTPAVKLEFMEYKDILEYEPEHLLNIKALQIDLLIIKKDSDVVMENEIGKIFRRHNIIEYKSPRASEDVDAFFKTSAYAGLYKTGKGGVSYSPEDITVTMIRKGKPRALFEWLEANGCAVRKAGRGIYYIENVGFFRTQVVVARELDETSHMWLRALTDNMDRRQAQMLISKSREMMNRPEAEYVEAVLQIAAKANRKLFEKLKKEDENMYSALVELMQPEIDEAVQKARGEAWDEAWGAASNIVEARKTVEAVDNAIKKLDLSKEKACAFMDITPAQYDAYRKAIKDAESIGRKGTAP